MAIREVNRYLEVVRRGRRRRKVQVFDQGCRTDEIVSGGVNLLNPIRTVMHPINNSPSKPILWSLVALVVCSATAAAVEERANQPAKPTLTLEASKILHQAVESASAIEENNLRESILGKIGAAQARAGDLKGARETAALIQNEFARAEVLAAVAFAQLQAEDVPGARQTASQIHVDPWLTVVIKQIETAQQNPGNPFPQRQSAYQGFMLAASPSESPQLRGAGKEVQKKIEADDFSGALEIALTIKDEAEKGSLVAEIAKVKAERGDLQGALRIADTLEEQSWHGWAMRQIASVQARTGDLSGALNLASSQDSPYAKACVLLGAAEGLIGESKTEPSPR